MTCYMPYLNSERERKIIYYHIRLFSFLVWNNRKCHIDTIPLINYPWFAYQMKIMFLVLLIRPFNNSLYFRVSILLLLFEVCQWTLWNWGEHVFVYTMIILLENCMRLWKLFCVCVLLCECVNFNDFHDNVVYTSIQRMKCKYRY